MKASTLTNQSSLFDIINRALTSPETICVADMNVVEQDFVDSNTEQQLSLACASLIAIIYSRPTLVNQTIAPLIQAHLGRLNNHEQSLQTLSLTLSYLIFTKAGKSAVASVSHALTTTQLNYTWQKQLLIMLREAIHWHPELIDLEAMLTANTQETATLMHLIAPNYALLIVLCAGLNTLQSMPI